jgi:hypothetical protein
MIMLAGFGSVDVGVTEGEDSIVVHIPVRYLHSAAAACVGGLVRLTSHDCDSTLGKRSNLTREARSIQGNQPL